MIFIDSTINTHNDHTKVLCPPHPFSVSGNDRMALTLVSFGMRRGWHNVNPTNNTVYVFVGNAYYKCEIANGTYSTFTALALAIKSCIDIGTQPAPEIISSNVSYNAITRKFTISFVINNAFLGTTVEVRCFSVKSGTVPNGVDPRSAYSDSYILLGAKPIVSGDDVFNSMVSSSLVTMASPHTASLNTLDAIYVHAHSIETGNYMSTAFDFNAQDSIRLIESSIFARIPVDTANFTALHEVISYEDNGNDCFQSFLMRKNLDSIDVRITDSRGRSLGQFDEDQAGDSVMVYRMALRWDYFQGPAIPSVASKPVLTEPLPSV